MGGVSWIMICLHLKLCLQVTQIHVVKINKQKFCALLDSGAEVSLIHTWVYSSLKEKTKLKKQSTFLQSVKGDSIDVN